MPKTPDTLQGTLELLVLKTIENDENHGFGITLHVQEASGGLLKVEEGSLYPALHRLEKQKLIRDDGRLRKTGAARAITVSWQRAGSGCRKHRKAGRLFQRASTG
jgi:DNA-binding PadR family transcriptional regulator